MSSVLGLFKNPSWDVALFIFLVACGFFWSTSKGKRALSFIIVSIYVLFALWPSIPLGAITNGRAPLEIWALHAGIFVALLLLLLLFMFRSFKGAFGGGEGIWWEILLLSMLGAGFLISIFLGLAPAEVIKNNSLHLTPLVLKFFASPEFIRWWTILPIFGVLFL